MSVFAPGVRVHIVGVGGAGMSGVARLLAEMGCVVSGSDERTSSDLDALRASSIDVAVGHDERNGASATVVTWSPAVSADNVELVAARQRHANVLSRSELLAVLTSLQPTIGLTGTHGKTTASSMMVNVLAAANRDDSRLLGAPVLGVGANGHWGGPSLVLEVDESYGTFALLGTYALGVLNVEPDHLDFYGSLGALETAFVELVERTSGPVVLWDGDDGARRVGERAARPVTTVSRRGDSTWTVGEVVLTRSGSTFTVQRGTERFPLVLQVIGEHNVADAAVVAVLAIELGIDTQAIGEGLARFAGAPRRFQHRGTWRGIDVYEDYAHLPGEIAATLAGAAAAGFLRVTAVFQPHRVTRTEHLSSAFGEVFDAAAHVIVTDIYDAGEPNPRHLTGEIVADAVARRRGPTDTYYAATFVDVVARLESLTTSTDVIVLLGAGDISRVVELLPGGLD